MSYAFLALISSKVSKCFVTLVWLDMTFEIVLATFKIIKLPRFLIPDRSLLFWAQMLA
jgi:hypothetical protein